MTASAHPGPGTGSDALAWAQLLPNVLDEGRRTATYKLAVLLALIDCCVVGTDAAGRAPERISTRELARLVLELYWRQVRIYPRPDGTAGSLRQSSQPKAVTIDAVRVLKQAAGAVRASTAAAAERSVPDRYERALEVIELNLVRMPLRKLQRSHDFTESGGGHYPPSSTTTRRSMSG